AAAAATAATSAAAQLAFVISLFKAAFSSVRRATLMCSSLCCSSILSASLLILVSHFLSFSEITSEAASLISSSTIFSRFISFESSAIFSDCSLFVFSNSTISVGFVSNRLSASSARSCAFRASRHAPSNSFCNLSISSFAFSNSSDPSVSTSFLTAGPSSTTACLLDIALEERED
ncbi:hypothetical protein PFISCL1PPCAC_6687, partial [Pristionchus fissidentatus]